MPGQRRVPSRWLRAAVGIATLAVLVWWLGAEPFLDPLRRLDAGPLVAAVLIAVPTTVCCAWRWQLVSRGLGSDLALGPAIAAYYRSQFLNTVLPGGVLGDVHRTAWRGRETGNLGHAARVVIWERTAGQVVQIALTIVLLLLLPSPVGSSVPIVAGVVVTGALFVVLALRSLGRGAARPARIARAVVTDVRSGLLSARTWPGVLIASTVVVAGHVATFVIAASAAGTRAPALELPMLALLVLLVAALPVNVAGWGPREAGAAGVFALAGLGAAQGVSTTVMYGVLVLVATLPGAAVLLVSWLRPPTRTSASIGVPRSVAHG